MAIALNLRDPLDELREREARVKEAEEKRREAEEKAREEFERIGRLKLSDKERELYELAKRAYFSGKINAPAKWTKAEVLRLGRIVQEEEEEKARQQRIEETIRNKPDNYHIITDDRELPCMIDRLREEVRLQRKDEWFREVFRLFNETMIRRKLMERGIEMPVVVSLTTWDTETSGTDKFTDLSGGYSFWLPLLNEGYYVAYGHLTGEKQCTRSKALGAIAKFMSLPAHVKSFHNAEFDLSILKNDGLEPRGVRYDTMDAQFILYDHEDDYKLKHLFAKYKHAIGGRSLELPDYTFEDLFGNDSPMKFPIKAVGVYAIMDVEKGWLLTKWQIDMLRKIDGLYRPYFEIRQYLPEVNTCIERTGFVVDLDEMKHLEVEYTKKVEEARQALFEAYKIDDDFLYKMSMALKGDEIRKWCEDQKRRIEKRDEMLKRCREELKHTNPKTKKYAQLKERIERYENETLLEAIPQNAPDYIHEFNLSSNDHVAYLIYDHLGIKDRTKEIEKDKNKTRSVSAKVLAVYFEEEESLKPLAEYAKYEKLLGTYVEKIPKALEADGRIHTLLRTVSTGRYGSSGYTGKPNDIKPDVITDENFLEIMQKLVDTPRSVAKGTNLQNIPSRNEEGLRVRKTFKPRKGYAFIGSDLSSIEPRLQAHRMATEFGDESFANMYRQGLDPYVEFAAELFDVEKELCLESAYKEGLVNVPYRKLTKDMFLAKGYGQAEDQFVKTAVSRGVSEEAAKKAYRKFDALLPGFRKMVEATFAHLRKHGWTATVFGQKRRFPRYLEKWRELEKLMRKTGIRGKNDPDFKRKAWRLDTRERARFWQLVRETSTDERAAFNHTIQGSGANILQLCMIRAYYECVLARGWEFNLTLHDELKFSVPNEQLTPKAVELVNDIMTNTVSLAVPLQCDTVIEPRWMEEYSLDEWDFEKCTSKGA